MVQDGLGTRNRKPEASEPLPEPFLGATLRELPDGNPKKSGSTAETFSDQFLRVGFGRTDFSRILIFELPDFVADFVAGFFLVISVGKVPR